MRILGLAFAAVLAAGLPSAVSAAPASPVVPYAMPHTVQFSMHSAAVDADYRIYVALPPDYKAASAKRYPVLYVLDANGFFGSLRELAHLAVPSGALPEVIIVGIGYPANGIAETYAQRARDYAPTPAGGAWKFQSFLRSELIPTINARYPTAPGDTALFGDSLGGAFALFTLFTQPDTFARYVVGSPAVAWGDIDLFKIERDFAFTNPSAPARVYIGMGEDEGADIPEILRFIAQVRSHRYEDLWLRDETFEGANHISVVPLTAAHGLREVFCDPPREVGCGATEAPPLRRLPDTGN